MGEFILKVHRHNQHIREDEVVENEVPVAEGKITSYMDAVDDSKKERDHPYIVKMITEYFSKKLFSTVTEIYMRKDDAETVAEEEDDEELERSPSQNDYEEAEDPADFDYGAAAGENKYAK